MDHYGSTPLTIILSLSNDSMKRPVSLPILVKALDGIFQGDVLLKELIHSDDFKNIPQIGAHARELQIAVQVSQSPQLLDQDPDAQVVDVVYRLQVQDHFRPLLLN